MSKIPRTFAFDKRIPPSEYHKYISVDDLLNESFEQIREEFQNYRKLSALRDLEEEKIKKKTIKFSKRKNQAKSQYQQSKNSNDDQSNHDSSMFKTQQKFNNQKSIQSEESKHNFRQTQNNFKNNKFNQKSKTQTNFSKVPIYSTEIHEDDNTKTVILKSMEKINIMRQRCEQLKRRAMQPNFGTDYISKSKNTIRKTNIVKDFIFQEKDFDKMEQEDDIYQSQAKREKENKQKVQNFFRNRKEIKDQQAYNNQGKLSQPYRVIYTASNFHNPNQYQDGNQNPTQSAQKIKRQQSPKEEILESHLQQLDQIKKQNTINLQHQNLDSKLQQQQQNKQKKVHYNQNQHKLTQQSTDQSYNGGNTLNSSYKHGNTFYKEKINTMGSSQSHHQMRKLKHKDIDIENVKLKTEQTLQKIDKNINKFSKTCLANSVFTNDINNMRADILKNARYNKVNRQIEQQFGEDLEKAFDNKADKQKQKEKESNILQYIQNVISNPKANSHESYTKNIPGQSNNDLFKEHKQRVIQMRLESVKPIKTGQKITKGTEELLSENKQLKKALMKGM